MSDAMSFAELRAQHVELLPARTVLSLLHTAINGGEAGTPGTNGASMTKFSLLGWIGYGGSNPSHPHNAPQGGPS